MDNIIVSILTATITACVTISISNKKIEIENITQERTKWRDKIRQNAIETSKAIIKNNCCKLQELRSNFMCLLNPMDQFDRDIIKCIVSVDDENERIVKEKEFTLLVASLLKHDWERAKYESYSWYRKFNLKNILVGKPERREEIIRKSKELSDLD